MTAVTYETVMSLEVEAESSVGNTVSRLQDADVMASVLSAAGVPVASSVVSSPTLVWQVA